MAAVARDTALGARAVEVSLLGALARGDTSVGERLFSTYSNRLYGLFRVTLATRGQAEAALRSTFATALERARAFESSGQPDVSAWVMDIALAEIARRPPRRFKGGPAAEGCGPGGDCADRHPPVSAALLAAISHDNFTVLVRTLDQRRRQALVLTLVCGLEPERVAELVGVGPDELPALVLEACHELRGRLEEHRRVEAHRAALTAKIPYHLSPLEGTAPRGSVKVRGTRVYLQPRRSAMQKAIRAIERFIDFLTRRHQDEYDPNDDIGGSDKRRRSLDQTPGMQEFDKPKLTPSLQGYDAPELTPGSAGYRAPKETPSTRRISSPRHSVPGGAMSYRWQGRP